MQSLPKPRHCARRRQEARGNPVGLKTNRARLPRSFQSLAMALATMEADFSDEVLTEAARSYFVLLAGEEALPARVASTPPVMASAGASSEVSVTGFALHAAYPNPFNPQTVVPFSVSTASRVELNVFDMLGRHVTTLAEGLYETGVYTAVFDGASLPSGMYLVRANVIPENGEATTAFTQRITLLK